MYNEADVYGVDEMIASNSFQELFNYIKTILEIKQKTNHYRANNFTVFSALRNETDEEKTHTTFLYEILRPNGQHGMKDAFLKDFFKTVLKVDSYNKTAKIFQDNKLFDYIEECYDSIHLSSYHLALMDLETILRNRGEIRII